jgi:hypothetical protein
MNDADAIQQLCDTIKELWAPLYIRPVNVLEWTEPDRIPRPLQ